jgi:hypothetical protein
MTPPRLTNPIASICVDIAVVTLIAGAVVVAFATTWPQALVVSWLFQLLRDTIKYSAKNPEDY